MALSVWSQQSSPGDTSQISASKPLSSSTSHSSSSSARSSPYNIPATRKSLDEIWTGFKLSCLHRQPFHGGLSFQDFFFKDPPPTRCGPAAALRSPSPATVMNLSSTTEFHFIDSADRKRSIQLVKTQPLKRTSEDGEDSGDRRHKRMIKNRESAARSRARKQAYTNQLENEVERLLEENARLRIQLEKFCSVAPAGLPKMHALSRTLTAPF